MKKINWQYAIGEIIIVIIGISIAFSLNNWKADWNDRKLKKQYLEHLAADVKEEIKQLEANQQQFSQKLETVKMLLPYLGVAKAGKDTMISKVFDLAKIIPFIPENTTHQTLINSGDFQLINDFEIRRKIEAHYAFHEIVLQNYQRIEEIHKKYFADFFIYKINYQKLRQGNLDFMDDPLLNNIILSLNGSYYMVMNINKECLESNQALLKSLEAAMK